jgi:hypothetical protein
MVDRNFRLQRDGRTRRLGLYLRSDVALKLPGASDPAIVLSDRSEVERAGYSRQNDRPILFSSNLKKAHEYLRGKSSMIGPIQDGGTQFFELRDPEGNIIEICQEP